MVKNAIITKDKFRISIPGVDVDVAEDYEFLAHEAHLSAQPYWSLWVECPFAGAGPGDYDADVDILVPSWATNENTEILIVPRGAVGYNYFPELLTFSGSYPYDFTDAWGVQLLPSSPPNMQVRFSKRSNSSAPEGAWIVFVRKE